VGRSLSRVPDTSPSCWCLLRSGSGWRSWSRPSRRRGGGGMQLSALPRERSRGRGRMAPAWTRRPSAAALVTCSRTSALRDRPGRPVEARCASPGAAAARPAAGEDRRAEAPMPHLNADTSVQRRTGRAAPDTPPIMVGGNPFPLVVEWRTRSWRCTRCDRARVGRCWRMRRVSCGSDHDGGMAVAWSCEY
jgi:hypothetical protein